MVHLLCKYKWYTENADACNIYAHKRRAAIIKYNLIKLVGDNIMAAPGLHITRQAKSHLEVIHGSHSIDFCALYFRNIAPVSDMWTK